MCKQLGDGRPIKLFVSGLHGSEHETTDPILEDYYDRMSEKAFKGTLHICRLGMENRKYVSTLDSDYWDTKTGKELLSIVEGLRPSIYTELHSYFDSSKLTDSERIERKGVPPLVELEPGILAGSVSPFLRKEAFQREDFCFLLEVPKNADSFDKVLEILEIIGFGANRKEIVEDLKKRYPSQMRRLKKYYELFYKGDLPKSSDSFYE
ncbi:hypothetical protein AKJ62_00660 [candidate division MSBL1 archaeon SCGC-AAA259D14]|uniref:DUF2119 domain-containing protein n=1 Tax=candidate division MSBL1 archaeon SCGC-AAA259D14 TaxID=1698261 RepID=A0A133U8K9_9EURY|nr:hypothetical protein AKJ62_00660 [candidate division MSBL1 archaeon SCGC-AAA259D14]